MPSIFKYIPAQYVASFLRGEVLFRSLAYFRDWEDTKRQVRGDRHEGTHIHHKPEGLELTLNNQPYSTNVQGAFQSRVKQDDIFVFCLSTTLSADLAREFETTVCIEIHNSAMFIAGVRSALRRRPSIKSKMLLHDSVRYYDAEAEAEVGVAWALPDVIAMSKTRDYEWQHEYHLAFATNNAFAIGNTLQALVAPSQTWSNAPAKNSDKLLKIGNLRRYCTIWRFDSDGIAIKTTLAC